MREDEVRFCPRCKSEDIEAITTTRRETVGWEDGLGSPGEITFTDTSLKCVKCGHCWKEYKEGKAVKRFIGVKELYAQKMNRREYNQYRKWEMPHDEDGADEGYLVEYIGGQKNHPEHKGYIAWLPKNELERDYRPADGMTFGLAIEALKRGHKVTRPGWRKKMGIFIAYKKGFETSPFLQMSSDDGYKQVWQISQIDVLAGDWQIV